MQARTLTAPASMSKTRSGISPLLHGSRQGLAQARTLTRCSRKLQRKVEISQPQPSHSVIFKLFIQAVFLIELIDTSASLSSFLLSCIERMTFGADFYVDVLLGRTCYKSITAVAGYSCLIVIRMDSFSHDFHLSIFILFYLR